MGGGDLILDRYMDCAFFEWLRLSLEKGQSDPRVEILREEITWIVFPPRKSNLI